MPLCSQSFSTRVCVCQLPLLYLQINNVLPDKIIVYRDGVGESMLETVTELEVRQLVTTFSTFEQYRTQPPGLTVVIVQKRINTRLFALNRQVSAYAMSLYHAVVVIVF